MKKKMLTRLAALVLGLAMLLSLTACTPAGLSPLQVKKAGATDLMENVKAEKVSGLACDEGFQKACYDLVTGLLKESYGLSGDNKNVLLSPLSVLTALGMTANGAGGETRLEMEQALLGDVLKIEDLNHYLREYYEKLPSSKDARFTFANSIWFRGEEGFTVEKDFLQINKNYYDPDIYQAPFDEATIQAINQWVDQKTEHLIPQVLEELNRDDMMALINALLFDAEWNDPFGSNTERPGAAFKALGGKERSVTMMSHDEHWLINAGDTIGVMKEYAGDKYRFVALLPRDNKADFGRYVDSLDGERIRELLDSAVNQTVVLRMPKFTVEYSTDLVRVLRNLGIEQAFDERADFSGISRDTPLAIGQVIHKTRLELDNYGTKAAAVTVVVATRAAMGAEGQINAIVLDRPFVYMIVDTENQLPIFMGVVTDIGE